VPGPRARPQLTDGYLDKLEELVERCDAAFRRLGGVSAYDAGGAPPQRQPGSDDGLVGAQPGDERLQRGLTGGDDGFHPLLKVAPASFDHDL
jgi:hypothetical protein